MELPKVSICIPVYGVEKYIGRCCKSLFEQTYENIEYIFVNDCSPDGSVDIIIKELENYPSRKGQVSIIEHKYNQGLASARNSAIRNVTGNFIVHVDSDDYIDSNMVECLVMEQRRSSADIVTCPAYYVYKKKQVLSTEPIVPEKKEYLTAIINRNIPSRIWGRLIRTELYLENGIKNVPGIDNSEDYQVFPQLLYFAHSFSWISNSFYYYNKENEGSYTNEHKEDSDRQVLETLNILRSFFKKIDVCYLEALEQGEIKVLGGSLRHWCYVKGHDNFYNLLVERLHQHRNKLQLLDWKTRVVLYTKRSIWQFVYKFLG